jgi:hypothetical protein
MTNEFKVFVTVFFIILAGSVWNVNPKDSTNASSAWKWQGQAFSKRLLLRNDGTLSLFARLLISLIFIICIFIVWF